MVKPHLLLHRLSHTHLYYKVLRSPNQYKFKVILAMTGSTLFDLDALLLDLNYACPGSLPDKRAVLISTVMKGTEVPNPRRSRLSHACHTHSVLFLPIHRCRKQI